ncbi:MAG: hypothetical protein ACK5PB_05920 [Pirellula sp.]
MNIHPITPPASPSFASPLFDVSFDCMESRTTYFFALVLPTSETTTVTEVTLVYHGRLRGKVCGPSCKQHEGVPFIDPNFEEK